MTAGTLADPCRMEISTFQDHILRRLIGTASLAAEDTGDTHRLFCIADAEVVFAQDMFLTVECDELCALGLRPNHNLMALDHVSIEAVHRLAISHHDIIGDVHDVVDGAKTDDRQLVLEPFGALLDIAVCDAQTGIALTGLMVFNIHLNGQVVVIDMET